MKLRIEIKTIPLNILELNIVEEFEYDRDVCKVYDTLGICDSTYQNYKLNTKRN
jgi:hypothetical protein